jgi:protein arginine N-methyltransferase 1
LAEYDLDVFGQLINDPVRMDAYDRALRETVKPGSVVLDIGTGTGILALLACRYGARRVHAVEVDPIIETARGIAAANGMQHRIEFHAVDSTQLELGERVDVVVSDIYGVLPLHRRRFPVLADARERLLKPGGAMIPLRERLWLALVSAPELHRVIMEPWVRNAYGLDMRAARDLAANQWRRVELDPAQLASEPLVVGAFDHASTISPHFTCALQVPVTRHAELHGIGMWFDNELASGVGFSNAPGNPRLIYGNAFFAWPEPVAAQEGDEVRLRVRATLSGEQYVWAWESAVLAGGDEARARASFRQATLLGMALAPENLRKVASEYAGGLNAEGETTRAVLEGLAGGVTLGAIAQSLRQAFPGRFADEAEALAQVTRICVRCGR